ncbi:acyl-CoA dehydrogenase family protein [Nocardia donostiensis]|uniref:Acyl-CoA dehydrogenase n=1 Tax=Nocardia donostiensis TaxID=1538463 RepID=A0A1V2TBV6_9NOCA|nr:acyl-CoA dehydrogenase family protein [Nocardia donostiensis]ONM46821.1 acyl-CoA dehydrogenase [Nocardia donostiensis]OQS16412.1 acyl-CoA dehydrogenase [Nocardia donostiensis]OQS19667.1 acyl-CoA dehydrogenase [Nocardia donostiensis]
MNRPAAFTPDEQALAEAVRGYCHAKCTEAVQRAPGVQFPTRFWTGLAELGIFAMAMPAEEGGAGDIVAASLELGRAAAPGPVAATFFAAHALPEDRVGGLVAGTELVSLGTPPLMPWAAIADVQIEWTGDRAWLVRCVGAVEPVETLGNEPWARISVEREQPLERVTAAADLFHLALAGYAVGAGRRVLDTAVEHARTREQFGRTIGSFQAVAHPLVNASLELEAAEKLSILAARAIGESHTDGAGLAAAARLSASQATMNAAFVSHQTLGAIGYSVEGPIGHITQRIRQITLSTDAESELGQRVLAAFSAEKVEQ